MTGGKFNVHGDPLDRPSNDFGDMGCFQRTGSSFVRALQRIFDSNESMHEISSPLSVRPAFLHLCSWLEAQQELFMVPQSWHGILIPLRRIVVAKWWNLLRFELPHAVL